MTKITFYGQDFTQIDKARVKAEGLEGDNALEKNIDSDGCGDLTYGDLLVQFVSNYKIPDQNIQKERSLFFYTNSTNFDIPKISRMMFGRWVGVFRNKKFEAEFEVEGKTTKKEFDVTLEIRCRFDTGENAEENKEEDKKENKGEKAYFLAAMLLCLNPEKDLKFIDPMVNISFHQVMDILLLFMYKKQLAEAAKKGIFRRYQRFENNDSRPHGTIDIARHIRENMGLESGRIAYHYRELTADNPVNRLILAAYKRLCEKFSTLCEKHINSDESVYSTLKMLQTELGWSKTSLRNIVKENLRPVTHPYFSEYEELRKICLKILRDENVSIFDADSCEETESLYMNITKLWEDFLESRIRKLLKEESFGLSLTTQGRSPGVDEKGKQIFVGRKELAEPDFVLWKGKQQNSAVAILDAKFKPRLNNFFLGDTDEFIDKDINKCIRDMVVFDARRTGVIFPVKKEEMGNGTHHKEYRIGSPKDDAPWFDMVRVPVPPIPKEKGASFEGWCKKLNDDVDKALKDYLDAFKNTVEAP